MKRLLLLTLTLTLALPAHARETVLTILHTNDIHGRVLSTAYDTDAGPGGLARITTMVRAIRGTTPNTILLDAGDAVQGTPTEFINQGRTMVDALGSAGYDAMTLGNHEFDWTQAVTEANTARAQFPVLSANALDRATGRPLGGAKESIILRRGGVRVAVFGLTTLDTPGIEWPRAISRVLFADPLPIARRLVPRLRKQADVVICLSHLGYTQDQALAKAVPGIDFIIGGHSHTTLHNLVAAGRCLIAQTGALGANLGRVDVRLARKRGAWRIESVNGAGGKWWGGAWPRAALLPAAETVARDPKVESGYRAAFSETERTLAETLGVAGAAIPAAGDKGRAELTLLLADLLKQAVRADVAMMPSDYGPSIPAGTFTYGDLYRLVGGFTRQNVVMVRTTGAALRAAVEKAYAPGTRDPVQFAGIGGMVTRNGRPAVWSKPTVNGRPLDEAATYTVAAGAYPIMGFPSLMASPLVSDRLGWLKPLLAWSIRERKAMAPVTPSLAVQG